LSTLTGWLVTVPVSLSAMKLSLGSKMFYCLSSGGFWKSGKGWDADTKLSNIESVVSSCVRNGAKVIGGCCKVTHTEIEAMRIALDKLKLRGDC